MFELAGVANTSLASAQAAAAAFGIPRAFENVAELVACPDFDDALALHKVLDAIEQSDETGRRVRVG
ncbi:hypothetical protein [Paraburkholderia sediminicola]|uniref:hypothetical protein n=1 Tax=Paraburkholderia sediminicola TaxID=458836 RepID=UPI0038BCBD2F